MSLNDLNNDCLLIIFNHLTSLEDLLSISNVCSRWSFLINHHSKIKNIEADKVDCLLVLSKGYFPIRTIYIEKQIDITELNIMRLFPNLKVVDIDFDNFPKFTSRSRKKIIQNNYSIKGVVCAYKNTDISMLTCFPNLEMLVCNDLHKVDNKPIKFDKMKQLYLRMCSFKSLEIHGDNLQNLERLYIGQINDDTFYNGPILSNLKVFIYTAATYDPKSKFHGFAFMDYCPALESVWLNVICSQVFVNSTETNLNLHDLVIDHMGSRSSNWQILQIILKKYPNLKHLAIRNSDLLCDAHVPRILKILPKIESFDFHGSKKITQKSVDFLEKYCEEKNLSIRMYNDRMLEHPYPGSGGEEICHGMNFMENFFFHYSSSFPVLVLPQI